MPGARRSQLAVEAARRAQEQRIRIGGEIRTMRERRGWTRTELARRAGIGRMVESRVERGLTRLDLDALQRIDVGLTDQANRRLLLVECWNTIGDVGAAARSRARKQADLEAIAASRWGPDAPVGVL